MWGFVIFDRLLFGPCLICERIILLNLFNESVDIVHKTWMICSLIRLIQFLSSLTHWLNSSIKISKTKQFKYPWHLCFLFRALRHQNDAKVIISAIVSIVVNHVFCTHRDRKFRGFLIFSIAKCLYVALVNLKDFCANIDVMFIDTDQHLPWPDCN